MTPQRWFWNIIIDIWAGVWERGRGKELKEGTNTKLKIHRKKEKKIRKRETMGIV